MAVICVAACDAQSLDSTAFAANVISYSNGNTIADCQALIDNLEVSRSSGLSGAGVNKGALYCGLTGLYLI